jgi:FlgD Ig-like domain
MPRRLWTLITIGISLTFLTHPAVSMAGVGIATSPSTQIDTLDPSLNLDPLPANTLVQEAEQLTFHWTSSDDNPGTGPDYFLAEVLIDQQVVDQVTWHPDISEFTWVWTAPQMQSGDCYLAVTAKDVFGNTTVATSERFTVLLLTTDVSDLPAAISLEGPYPNPFNPSCELAFSLPVSGFVDLGVYDTRGRRIKNLVQESNPAGTTRVRWDGTDQQGRPQPGGLYFFVLNTPGPDEPVRLVRKAILIP